MRIMPPVDVTKLPAAGSAVPTQGQGTAFPSGLTGGQGTLYLMNKSNFGLYLLFEDGSLVAIPAWFARPFTPPTKTGQLWFSQAYQLQNGSVPPIQQLWYEVYQPKEDTTGLYSGPIPYQSVVGGNVTTTAAVDYFNVKAPPYNAKGDGVTDDTAAIQAAITAAQVAGGVVYFPMGTYVLTASLIIGADNVQLLGDGWASELIWHAGITPSTAQVIVQGPGGAGNFRNGIIISELSFNGNNLVVAAAGALDLVSCTGALLDHIRCRNFAGTAIHWDGIAGAQGNHNFMRDCFILGTATNAVAGVLIDQSSFVLIEGGRVSGWAAAGAFGVEISNVDCSVVGVQFDGNDTGLLLTTSAAGRATVNGCTFDGQFTRHIWLNSFSNAAISGNFFGARGAGGTGTDVLRVDSAGNDKNVVTGNTVIGASGWTNFVHELASPGGHNTYAGNDTGGLTMVLLTGIARGNQGYNPVGHAVTQPAVPASTTPLTNTTGVDCTVFVNGGTVSAVAVGGTATGQIAGNFRVPAGQTITLTYTVAPTWQWFGD